MKTRLLILAALLSPSFLQAANSVEYDPEQSSLEQASSTIELKSLPEESLGPESRILFSAGAWSVTPGLVTTTYYETDYQNQTDTFLIQAGWEIDLFRFAGKWSIRVDAGYSQLTTTTEVKSLGPSRVTLHLIPIIGTLTYRLDIFSKYLVPFLRTGGGGVGYFQSAEIDGLSGSKFEPTYLFSGGLRHSLAWMGFSSTEIGSELGVLNSFRKANPSGTFLSFYLSTGL